MSTEQVNRWHCKHEGCEKSFARKEHLNRHERTHLPAELFICNVCNQKFNRSDSLHRHLIRHGDEFKPTPSGRSKKACVACHKGKIKCDGNQPCSKCASKGSECKYEQQPSQNSSGKQSEDAVTTPEFPPFTVKGIIDWASMMVRKPSESPAKTESDFEDEKSHLVRPSVSDEAKEEYIDSYFRHFHHRWPIIHRPSYLASDHSLLLSCAVTMIGAWSSQGGGAKMYSIVMQDYLVARIPVLLQKRHSGEQFQGTLPAAICQTALLVIIHSFTTGIERLVSSSMLILASLVTILHETEFFNPATVYKDEKLGYFLPMHHAALGERQRLAQYLFKIDKYFSILRGHRGIIPLDALHFPPPSSYALWNGDGLDVWESRVLLEPSFRGEISMAEIFGNSFPDQGSDSQPILVEDVQMYMCALQPMIWQLHKGAVQSIASSSLIELKTQLDAIKYKLGQMASQQPNLANFGEEEHLLYRYYFGYEDQNKEGWQRAPIMRAKTLIFDALSFYHVLAINLYSNVPKIRQLAKDLNLDNKALNDRHRKAQDSCRTFVSTWAKTQNAEAALHHANQILSLHKCLTLELDFEQKGLDAITYGGLQIAMIVVWAYCMFSDKPCARCDGTEACILNKVYAEIDGLQVCLCNTNELVEKFRAFLPDRWNLPETTI